MNKRRGFTLVEVIVSLAVLGIIAISFLGAISSHFTYMMSTKKITQNAFKAQEKMEDEIDDAKVRVKNPSAALEKMKIFTSDLGGIEVKYEEVKITHNNKDYYTLVSNIMPDALEIIKLESIGIKLMQGATQVEDDYYGYTKDSFSIVGNFNNSNAYKWDHLLNQVEWYISSDKYNIPLPKKQGVALNDDESHYYPIFPRDYEIFSNETVYKFGASQNTFPYMEDIAGRHLIYTVIPAAKSGKLGERKISKPIYISGLTVTDNLITHLDASYIDVLSNSTEAQLSGANYMLLKWNDVSSVIGRSTPNENAAPPNNTSRPIVNRSAVEDAYIGQYVYFNSGKSVQINQGSNGAQVTIYAVLRNRGSSETKYITNGTNTLLIEAPAADNEEQWNIIRSKIKLSGTTIKIGDSDTDIAEIIIYTSIEDDDNTKVIDYLRAKYFTENITIND